MRVWDLEDGSKDSFTNCDWGDEWLVGRERDRDIDNIICMSFALQAYGHKFSPQCHSQ